MSDRGYDVGYGKPPKQSRFQKGQSGNPRGRPKGSLNVATALERELNQLVTIKENGVIRHITKFQAAIKQITNKAATGDTKCIQFMLNLLNVSNGGSLTESPLTVPHDADLAVMASMLRRFQTQTTQPLPDEESHEPKA